MVDYILGVFSGPIAGLKMGDLRWTTLLGGLWVVDFAWGTLGGRL